MDDRIEVVDYDPAWPGAFERERDVLARELGLPKDAFEHIGSTAVAGLIAKPTIDLMIGAEPLDVGEPQVRAMERLGYTDMGEFGIPGRRFFRKGEARTHHVHWVRRGADFWTKQLVFRDYLRATPAEREPYASLKRDLARTFSHDRPAYTAAKTDFILRLQERAWLGAGAGLIVFDLEATCWEGGQTPERMETIEIGAVRLGADLKPADEFRAFIRPREEPVLSAFCSGLTGISQKDVDAARAFPDVLQAFVAWAGTGLYRLASWSGYDLAQLRQDCRRTGAAMPPSLERYVDLRELHCRLRCTPPGPMTEALRREGIPLEGTLHRGIDDARNLAALACRTIEALRAFGGGLGSQGASALSGSAVP